MNSPLARIRSRSEPAPSFALRSAYAGVHRLYPGSPSITLNGVTVVPELYYLGIDATPTAWPSRHGCGPTLTTIGGGVITPPTSNTGFPTYGPLDDSVTINGGKRYIAPSANTFQLGTDDWVIEMLVRLDSPLTQIWLDKMISQTGGGIMFWGPSARLVFLSPGASYTISAVPLGLTWSYIVLAMKYGEKFYPYGNGVAGVVTDVSAATGTLSNTSKFCLGGLDDMDTLQLQGGYALFAGYHRASWLAIGGLQSWVSSRFAALVGGPTVAQGSAVPDVMTRSTPTHVDKWEGASRRIYYVGANWPALHSRKDSAGRTLAGVAPDLARINLALQSQALNTTWTKVALTSITDNSGVGPDGTAVLDGIIGDANDVFHGVSQACTLTAATYTLSMWVRAGNKTWAYIDDTTVAGATGYFNLGSGVVGTKGAGAGTIGIEDWGGGLYRCWITVLGTAAAHTIRFGAAHADTDNDFAGDAATINVHCGCINVTAADSPTAYIPTTTAAVARTVENLRWPGLANLGGVGSAKQGGFRFKVLAAPAFLPGTVVALVGASDGGAAGDSIAVTVGTDGYVDVVTAANGGAAGASAGPNINVLNGAIHEIVVAWSTNRLTCWVDGVQGTVDAACDMPDELDRLEVGQGCAGALQGRVLIADLKAFSRPLSSPIVQGSGFRS